MSAWPKGIDSYTEKEKSGEVVKNCISQVRSWKSEQGIALNSRVEAVATYSSKNNIKMIKPSSSIIISTLNYPKDHEFKEGKPDVEEKITKLKPIYSKIGPSLKKNAKEIIKNVRINQDEIIKKIENNGDISLSEIHPTGSKNEFLIKDGYFQIEKEVKVKGKKDSKIITFDDFYLEIKN